MALEKWLAVGSLALFAMFSGEMASIYYFMLNVPEDFEYAAAFEADPKVLQFVSIGAAPAGVLAAVSFIMSKRYGSRPVGMLIIGGGVAMLSGMAACHMMIPGIDEDLVTGTVMYVPMMFMALSAPVMAFGGYLTKHKKRRPKKEYF